MRSKIRLQPILNLQEGRVIGYEALYQKQHTGRYPSAINLLKNVVDSCDMHLHSFQLFINMTTSDLLNDAFARDVLKMLNEYQIEYDRVVFEINEKTHPAVIDQSIDLLWTLRRNDIHIALDDFGLNCSLVNFSKNPPIDFIKIDQAFVQQSSCNERALRTIQHLVKISMDSDCETIAEGIESKEQLEIIRNTGISMGQGFLFSPKNSPSAFVQLDEFYNHLREQEAAA